MLAYHNDPALKASLIAQMKEHMAADQLVRGQYWRPDGDGVWRGCAVGCLTHDDVNAHEDLERLAGIPLQVGHLIDALFENLPGGRFEGWPLEVLEAIPVGADLSMVWPRQAIYLLDQVEQYDESGCCKAVKDLYSRLIRGETVDKNEWVAAADAARAAYYAARVAARAAYAADAAYYAARAAADAARAAAYAAARADDAAAYAARATAYAADVSYSQQADHLLKLLRETEENNNACISQ